MKIITELQLSVNAIQAELAADEPIAENVAGSATKLKFLAELLIAKYDSTTQPISHENVDTLKLGL